MDNQRFEIGIQLGEGSFSIFSFNLGKIYQAYDKKYKRQVALKLEKEDKSKKILRFEYETLKKLQGKIAQKFILGLSHIPKLYDFVENNSLNFMVMELLGRNVANYKKLPKFDLDSAYNILDQMLDAIESLHNKGFIHRDIKPTNFVVDHNDSGRVYMVDFGLAKNHLNQNGVPYPERLNTDFRGTLTYASLNAHYKMVNFNKIIKSGLE